MQSILPRSKGAVIKDDTMTYRRPKENSPDPGLYDAHLTPFGSQAKTFRIGESREEKPNRNPGPGYYDPEIADSQIKYNNRSAIIREDVMKYKR